jgi:hypothetical protein
LDILKPCSAIYFFLITLSEDLEVSMGKEAVIEKIIAIDVQEVVIADKARTVIMMVKIVRAIGTVIRVKVVTEIVVAVAIGELAIRRREKTQPLARAKLGIQINQEIEGVVNPGRGRLTPEMIDQAIPRDDAQGWKLFA